jgi:hypothetical protein
MGAGLKLCDLCQRRFQPRSNRQRFCSPMCRFTARAVVDATRYDKSYRRQRQVWRPRVAMGGVPCGRCREPIEPAEAWDLDHLGPGLLRPSHRYCNRAQPSLEHGRAQTSRAW